VTQAWLLAALSKSRLRGLVFGEWYEATRRAPPGSLSLS